MGGWVGETCPSEEVDFVRERSKDGDHDHIEDILLHT